MSSKYFMTMLVREIESFLGTFAHDSNSLFKDVNNKLIHPGEYGSYRERCFRNLLQCVLKKDYKVSDGFIITAKDSHISTQCDVLVYKSSAMPITDNGIANFYPVEDVCAIIEMKSNLTTSALKDALRKLSEVKKLGKDRRNNKTKSNLCHQDTIPTFLVCNRLESTDIDFEQIYAGIDREFWHNGILSVEDGFLTYCLLYKDLPKIAKQAFENLGYDVNNGGSVHNFSQLKYKVGEKFDAYDCPINFIDAHQVDRYRHIISFLLSVIQSINMTDKYSFDPIEYMGYFEEKI